MAVKNRRRSYSMQRSALIKKKKNSAARKLSSTYIFEFEKIFALFFSTIHLWRSTCSQSSMYGGSVCRYPYLQPSRASYLYIVNPPKQLCTFNIFPSLAKSIIDRALACDSCEKEKKKEKKKIGKKRTIKINKNREIEKLM